MLWYHQMIRYWNQLPVIFNYQRLAVEFIWSRFSLDLHAALIHNTQTILTVFRTVNGKSSVELDMRITETGIYVRQQYFNLSQRSTHSNLTFVFVNYSNVTRTHSSFALDLRCTV